MTTRDSSYKYYIYSEPPFAAASAASAAAAAAAAASMSPLSPGGPATRAISMGLARARGSLVGARTISLTL